MFLTTLVHIFGVLYFVLHIWAGIAMIHMTQ